MPSLATPDLPTSARRALVIGGSMAGLLAARVLSDHYEDVLVLDRDVFPDTPDHRAGVPQSHHAHGLLVRGHEIISGLFPGLLASLAGAGAFHTREGIPVLQITPAGKLPSTPLGGRGEYLAFSRFLLEWHMRQWLREHTGVRFLPAVEVTGLLAGVDGQGVRGVRVRPRGGQGGPEVLEADLVVEASGRASKLNAWLTDLGYDPAPEESINSDIGYASRFYRRPEGFPAPWHGLIINGRPPHNPRAGLILPVEDGRWHVTLGGFAGHHPPTDEAGFLTWARDLPDPSLYEAIRVAEPLTRIRGYRTPTNTWRHFERLKRWPRHLIALGDAVCHYNPIYGQGMSAAALSAQTLGESLSAPEPESGFEPAFQRALARVVAVPWQIATGEDLRWPGVRLSGEKAPRGQGLRHAYGNLVLRQAVEDPVVADAFLDMIMNLRSPTVLARPRVLVRVLGSAVTRALGGPERGHEPALSPEAVALLRTQPDATPFHT